jgi:hypothetical protein
VNGVPNLDNTFCHACPVDQYLENGKCKECQEGYYAPEGSIGAQSCLKRPICAHDDVKFLYTKCKGGKRDVTHTLR